MATRIRSLITFFELFFRNKRKNGPTYDFVLRVKNTASVLIVFVFIRLTPFDTYVNFGNSR